jgi:hypothetical protein
MRRDRRLGVSFLRKLIVAVALTASTSSVFAASAAPPAAPGPDAKDAKTLVSTNSMRADDYAACVSDLTARKVVFEQVGAVTQQGCQLLGAIELTSVPTAFGDVSVSGKPTTLCGFARQFSDWVRDVGAPLTLAYTGQKLGRIEVGSSFRCSARYDKPGQIPSEHAKGDAMDIFAFVLANNRSLHVKQEDSESLTERDLIRVLRTTACAYFTTVLGPGTDPAHAEHLHFDTGMHGATPNYRICE